MKISIRGQDTKGREVSTDGGMDDLEIDAAYLKLINVPCMFDTGATPAKPNDP